MESTQQATSTHDEDEVNETLENVVRSDDDDESDSDSDNEAHAKVKRVKTMNRTERRLQQIKDDAKRETTILRESNTIKLFKSFLPPNYRLSQGAITPIAALAEQHFEELFRIADHLRVAAKRMSVSPEDIRAVRCIMREPGVKPMNLTKTPDSDHELRARRVKKTTQKNANDN